MWKVHLNHFFARIILLFSPRYNLDQANYLELRAGSGIKIEFKGAVNREDLLGDEGSSSGPRGSKGKDGE
jgi:hypothetical protein